MSVNIGDALQNGLGRVGTQAGAIFVGALFLVGVAMTIAQESLMAAVLRRLARMYEVREALREVPDVTSTDLLRAVEEEMALAYIEAGIPIVFAVILGVWILRVLVKIGAIRWFVEKQSGGVDPGLFVRRIVWTLGNLFVGWLVYVIAVTIGLLFFVIPGIFLGVVLYFYNYEIVVEGENAFTALGNSWELTKGNRIELFALGALFTVVGFMVGWIVGVVTSFSPIVATIATTLFAGLFGVATIAVAGEAYNQLRGASGTASIAGSNGSDDGPATL